MVLLGIRSSEVWNTCQKFTCMTLRKGGLEQISFVILKTALGLTRLGVVSETLIILPLVIRSYLSASGSATAQSSNDE